METIAFTGSKGVGLGIIQAAATVRPGQRSVKRVIAEMGGKNAIIVDSDADLDETIVDSIYSAFGYQGQKCSALSRLIVLEENYDRVMELHGALSEEQHTRLKQIADRCPVKQTLARGIQIRTVE